MPPISPINWWVELLNVTDMANIGLGKKFKRTRKLEINPPIAKIFATGNSVCKLPEFDRLVKK